MTSISSTPVPASAAPANTGTQASTSGFQTTLASSLGQSGMAAEASVSGGVTPAPVGTKQGAASGASRPEKKDDPEEAKRGAEAQQSMNSESAVATYVGMLVPVSVPVDAPVATGGQGGNAQSLDGAPTKAGGPRDTEGGRGSETGPGQAGLTGQLASSATGQTVPAPAGGAQGLPAAAAGQLATEIVGSRPQIAEPQGGREAAASSRASNGKLSEDPTATPAAHTPESTRTNASAQTPKSAGTAAVTQTITSTQATAVEAARTSVPAQALDSPPGASSSPQGSAVATPLGTQAGPASNPHREAAAFRVAASPLLPQTGATAGGATNPAPSAGVAHTNAAGHGAKDDAKSGSNGAQQQTGGSGAGPGAALSGSGMDLNGAGTGKSGATAADGVAFAPGSSVAVTAPERPAEAISSAGAKEAGSTPEALPASLPAPVNTARVLASMGGTEMRVGMHSAEFGSISISTSVSQAGVQAQIALDHEGLGKALMGHLPGVEDKLGSALGVTARVEVRDGFAGALSQGGSGGSGGFGGGQASAQGGRQGRQGDVFGALQQDFGTGPAVAAGVEAVSAKVGAGARLSVHA